MRTFNKLRKAMIDRHIVLEDCSFSPINLIVDGRKVSVINDGYVSLEDENGEWVDDIEFEDIQDNEIEEIYNVVEQVIIEEEKTMKKIRNENWD